MLLQKLIKFQLISMTNYKAILCFFPVNLCCLVLQHLILILDTDRESKRLLQAKNKVRKQIQHEQLKYSTDYTRIKKKL